MDSKKSTDATRIDWPREEKIKSRMGEAKMSMKIKVNKNIHYIHNRCSIV